ncbi:MAG: hypothetical protein ACKKL5_01280 [Candidatus Komeilibacteria bacterium]
MSIDWERLVKIIKKTKEKLIIATKDDLLVLLDLDSYEKLLTQKTPDFIASAHQDNQNASVAPVKWENDESAAEHSEKNELVEENKQSDHQVKSFTNSQFSAVGDVIATRRLSQDSDINKLPDEEDEYFFEELDEES